LTETSLSLYSITIVENTLAQKAIDFALSGQWSAAIKINLQIIEDNPQDVDALNRLARAHSELGKLQEARSAALKVITIDPLNPIALKCLEKWKDLKSLGKNHSQVVSVDSFLEEPGKTKLVSLLNTGDERTFATTDPGEEVKLSTNGHRVTILTQENRYLGRLPDDISARIKNLIKDGYKYQVLIKSIDPKDVTVFMREVEKGKGDNKMVSFPTEKIEYVSFTPPELVHKDEPFESGEDLEEVEGFNT